MQINNEKRSKNIQIFRSDETPWKGSSHFRIRHLEASRMTGRPVVQSHEGFGPLILVMHVYLNELTVPMHEHRNDEILSYIFKGKMLHRDSHDQEKLITRNNIMMMNAGKSFYHEESTPEGPVEMLQILIRPYRLDLEPNVSFFERSIKVDAEWNLLAGPPSTVAPLTIRNDIYFFDTYAKAGDLLDIPEMSGMTPLLFVMDGKVEVEGHELSKGDVISADSKHLNKLSILEDTTLVLFLANLNATGTLKGDL